jgi:CRP/FNR family transcriptional regulator, cyclic AMP receptor protein
MDECAMLKQVPLFSPLDDQQLMALQSVMEPCAFAAGEVIIREGEPGDYFYVVLQGHVQFLLRDAGGHELMVDETGPGESFGELSVLTGEPRSVRARAIDDVTALGLTQAALFAFLRDHPSAAIELLRLLGRRLYRADSLLSHSVSPNVNELHAERLTFGQRIADSIAAVMGSWPFIITQSCLLVVWVILNVIGWMEHWDPYPFILLNLGLSLQAAYAAPIIMMSQNRQADKDRLAADVDHQVNVNAEVKTELILSRLEELERSLHPLHAEQPAAPRKNRPRKLAAYKRSLLTDETS